MSILKKLEATGLDVELESLLGKFLKDAEGAPGKELRKVIDDSGLNSPKTMKLIGGMQRTGDLNPGLYKELVALNKRLESPVTSTSAPAPAEQSGGESVSSEAQPTPAQDEQQEPVAAAPAPAEVASLVIADLTDKEEEEVKKRVAKEEEKMRKRLMDREVKIRERMKARAEKKAQRQGLNLETLQAIKEKKDEYDKVREELKVLRETASQLRDEIKALRPQRKKKDKAEATEKRSKKKDKAEAASAPAS